MNLKILTGLLTTSMFIVSCGNPINPVPGDNAANKQNVMDIGKANVINNGSTVKFKINLPSFKTKASADGYTIKDIDYFLVNLTKNPTNPLQPGHLLSDTWQIVDVNNEVPLIAVAKPEVSYDIVIKNVTGGTVNPGATWYGVLRAFASDDHEIGVINETLVDDSLGQRIAVSSNSVNVKKSDNRFYSDDTFTPPALTVPPVLDINLAVQVGATIGADLNVNSGSVPGEYDITVEENVPILCFSCSNLQIQNIRN